MGRGEPIEGPGVWWIREDAEDAGVRDKWFAAPPRDGWREIEVPSAWQTVLGDDASDVCWYRATIQCADVAAPRERTWLRFDAVATRTDLWVNGVRAGSNEGDWMPFEFDVTALLKPGAMDIMVRVDRVRPEPEQWVDGAPLQGGHITKGFHDVISVQHAGIWQAVWLRRTGPIAIVPDGAWVEADPETGACVARVEVEGDACGLEVVVFDADGVEVSRATRVFGADAGLPLSCEFRVDQRQTWDVDRPALYRADVRVLDRVGWESDACSVRFGFRDVRCGGPENRQILLNGRPIFVRGILDWGHEPDHVAPAPSEGEVRARLATLREMGFNAVCLCMWYPPRWFHDIADEMGVLIWQEHPVWKSRMSPGLNGSYRAQFERFFRRDRGRPSVVIVSATCEHERFDPELAGWWWERARALLPRSLVQINTAFLEWGHGLPSDLHDEHTYESSGRWAAYLHDLDAELRVRDGKPFVMGESVLYVSPPDVHAIGKRIGEARPWWTPRALDSVAALRREIDGGRYGALTAERFAVEAGVYHLRGRAFQMELYRARPLHAGIVTNHLRDVPICPCGFMDDLGRWRFGPEQTRSWLGDAVLLLRTPENLRAFEGGSEVRLALGLSNFSRGRIRATALLEVRRDDAAAIRQQLGVEAEPGEIAWAEFGVALDEVEAPGRVKVLAQCDGAEANRWDLWVLPKIEPVPGIAALDDLPLTEEERSADFEERRYSSGWGLSRVSWRARPGDPSNLVPWARRVSAGGGELDDARVLLTHRLTRRVLDWTRAGGSTVLLAGKAAGSPPTRIVPMWAISPLIADREPIRGPNRELALETLDYDLTRHWIRTVPTAELGLHDAIMPLVRLVRTHDARDEVAFFDSVFAGRHGRGLVVVTSLDHHEPVGRFLLGRLLAWAAHGGDGIDGEIPLDVADSWAV
ncbi:MAG: hypothetical protein H6811_11515 [Phycisphaeraceae bacterium]|nr:hypothetical protein [Phycisphaeraceae bacterium]